MYLVTYSEIFFLKNKSVSTFSAERAAPWAVTTLRAVLNTLSLGTVVAGIHNKCLGTLLKKGYSNWWINYQGFSLTLTSSAALYFETSSSMCWICLWWWIYPRTDTSPNRESNADFVATGLSLRFTSTAASGFRTDRGGSVSWLCWGCSGQVQFSL